MVREQKLARNLIALPVGNTVKLDCSAQGYPRPTVRWYKDAALLQERKRGSKLRLSRWTTVLVLKDVVPSDSGRYTCNVSNAHGWINHSYYVDVHGKKKVYLAHRIEVSLRLMKELHDFWLFVVQSHWSCYIVNNIVRRNFSLDFLCEKNHCFYCFVSPLAGHLLA